MKISMRLFRPVLLASIFTLAACGGGGSSGTETGTNQIPDDFDLFEQTATWRLAVDIDSLIEISIPTQTDSINNSIETGGSIVTAASFQVSGGQILETSCSADAPTTTTATDFVIDIVEDDDGCTNETTTFTKISNSEYRIEYSCDGVLGGNFSYTLNASKLSDQANLDFGTLSFTSNSMPNLDTSDGVCGFRYDGEFTSSFTPQPNSLGLTDETGTESTISVAAPYDGNRIEIEFSFPATTMQIGNYTVVDDAEIDGEVEVEIASVNFGGTADEPDYIYATSGTVAISSIGASSATGTFDLTTELGDTIVGSFSFNIP